MRGSLLAISRVVYVNTLVLLAVLATGVEAKPKKKTPTPPPTPTHTSPTIREQNQKFVETNLRSQEKQPAPKQTDTSPKTQTTQPSSAKPAVTTSRDSSGKGPTVITLNVESLWPSGRHPRPRPDVATEARVAPGLFETDITLAGNLRGWRPVQVPSFTITKTMVATAMVDFRFSIADVIRVHRAFFETNQPGAIAVTHSRPADPTGSRLDQMAWLLGLVGLAVDSHWEPVVRYERRTYLTHVTPNLPIRIVRANQSTDVPVNSLPLVTSEVLMAATFQTLLGGVLLDIAGERSDMAEPGSSWWPLLFAGVGYVNSTQPYALRVGAAVQPDFLYEAEFSGGGLALGLSLPPTPGRLFFDAHILGGGGRIRVGNQDIEKTLPPGWKVACVEMAASAGYVIQLAKRPGLGLLLGGSWSALDFTYEKDGQDSIAANSSSQWALTSALLLTL